MKATKLILILSTTLLFLTGCGSNDSSSSGSIADNGNTEHSQGNGSETTPPVNENITFSAAINDPSGIFGDGQVINYNNATKSLEITVPFPLAALLPNASGTLPKHPNIAFETDSLEKTLTLSVPIRNYVELVESPTTLPNGRPLPGVNGGEPPSFGFPLGFLGLGAYGYAAFDSLSIFIESSFKLPINFEVPIKSEQDGSHIGKVHWLAPLSGQSGGVFISFRLPKELSVILANSQ
ncbi:MAG: hypothetical protein ACRBBP_06130 [Bdellovibrionales bacterium]